MKNIYLFLFFIFGSFVSNCETTLDIVSNGTSKYQIVIPEMPDVVEVQAAKVLQDYIHRISGYSMPIVDRSNYEGRHGISIGKIDRFGNEYSNLKVSKDGFIIKTKNNELILAGGNGKGVLYAAYTFLDKYLGCRKFSIDVTYVPKRNTISIGQINDIENPAFDFRETYYNEVWDAEYMDWHKLNSVSDRVGNKSEWGLFVHTFGRLLSPEEYGEEHPEYFSYYDGRRHPEAIPSWDGSRTQPASQLCLSNPDVLEIVCENLKIEIEKNPDALYWSVSQNDNVNYCQCDKCAALDAEYAAFRPEEKLLSTHGGRSYSALGMGSLLTFVNKVADRFPDKIISTLAYQYSRVPPKGITPRKNVNIMLCSIESTRNDPIVVGDLDFRDDLIGWSKLTNNIIVWDYVIRFSNLLAPFPNLYTLQPNLKFFHDNGVSMIFEQGNRDSGGEFAELRAYLISRLLWNPNLDFEKELDEFLTGFYGGASEEIRQYIDLTHKYNQSGGSSKMSIFGSPVDDKETFLSEDLINQYKSIFETALQKTKKTPEVLERVLDARLPVYYAELEIAKDAPAGYRGLFTEYSSGDPEVKKEFLDLLYDFYYQCLKRKVSRITEWRTTPTEYAAEYLNFVKEAYE